MQTHEPGSTEGQIAADFAGPGPELGLSDLGQQSWYVVPAWSPDPPELRFGSEFWPGSQLGHI